MNLTGAVYNEKSWAIDLIGHIKVISSHNNRSVRDAGGERTVSMEGGSLFPDVILFGDQLQARILQGWELKMPDTSIDDYEFLDNAEKKANALGLDSFLLWNVTYARLYARESGRFNLKREWSDLADILERSSVDANRRRWENLAEKIIGHMNDLFDGGTLEGRQFIDAYRSGGVTALIMENSGLVESALKQEGQRNAGFRAGMVLWWDKYKTEYDFDRMEEALSRAVIFNWISKILLANILREKDKRVLKVAEIGEDTQPSEALELFRLVSEECDFWTVFSDSLGLVHIPEKPWNELKQFNGLLADLRIGSVDQLQLTGILEATVEEAKRKIRGQYPTPIELARLLVNLCVQNVVSDRVLDPCCGSGTIARVVLERKMTYEVLPGDAAATVYAGDQDPLATQIAAFSIANLGLMHKPIRVFQKDAFTLNPSTTLEFQNPTDGTRFSDDIGRFETIVSNLPFVSQQGRNRYQDAIQRVKSAIEEDGYVISGRADIAAYFPFSLYPLLTDNGWLGIIITNAWQGTDWGDTFYNALSRYYHLECVVTSGAGRWFKNSEVVTNLLILVKKSNPDQESRDTKFVVLTRPLSELADEQNRELTAAQIKLGQTQNETLTIRSTNHEDLMRFRRYGLGGNAQFVNCDWILDLPLQALKDQFQIRRGERRGMNALFYPAGEHGIEEEYIYPLVKSPTDFTKLCGEASKEAFSCSRSEQELEDLGHTGALRWIKRFDTDRNIQRLSRQNLYWYEMKVDSLTELVMSINYGDRLFVGRLVPPAFVDQRLVRLNPKHLVDLDLYHALLNCTVGLFMIEGLGFGRGLGALDLNKDRIEGYMHMLDPTTLCEGRREKIKSAFKPLLDREILSIADELEEADRQVFDDEVMEVFGLNFSREELYDSLRGLVGIRFTAGTSL